MSATHIDPQIAYTMVKDHKAILVDVREAEEFSVQHIANAHSMPLSQLGDIIEQLVISDDQDVVIHCRMGPRGDKAAAIFIAHGIDEARIYNIAGGITSWAQDGLPVIEG